MKTLQAYFLERGETNKHHISVDIKPHGVAIDLYHKKTESNYYTHNGFAVIGNVVFPSGVGQGTDLDFSQALALMKDGEKVSRPNWLSKENEESFVCLGEGNPALDADKFWNKHTNEFVASQGDTGIVNPYFIKASKNGRIVSVQMGWIPSQEDLLADDWYLMT